MTRMAASKARDTFSDTLNKVACRGERIILERYGKAFAAIIPIEDLKLLEAMEDQADVKIARRALKEVKKKGTIPYRKARKELGFRRSPARPRPGR